MASRPHRRTSIEVLNHLNSCLKEYNQRSRIKEFHTKRIVLVTGETFLENEAVTLVKRIENKQISTYLKNFDKIYLDKDESIVKEIKREIQSNAGKKSAKSNQSKPWNQCKEYRLAKENNEEFYFTGIPCIRGHISKRKTSNGICIKCSIDIYRTRQREDYSNSENTLYTQFKTRRQAALREGIPFTIEFDDLELPEFCPVFGVKLEYSGSKQENGKQTRNPNKASIDKLIPELGYIPGNVFVVSWRANNLKSNMSIDQLEMILKYMKDNIKNG